MRGGRKLLVVTALGALALFSPSPVPTVAQQTVRVVLSSAVTDFPWSLSFRVTAQADAPINRVTLRYGFEGDNDTTVVNLPVNPAREVNLEHRLDLTRDNRPPELDGRFRWTVWDTAGNSAETDWQTFRLEDSRFRWKQIASSQVVLFWHQGPDQFGRDLLSSADAALARLNEELGVSLNRPARIVVYENQRDMLDVLSRQSGELTGGITYPTYGIIIINISNNNLDFGKRAIPHELTHLLIQERLKGALVPVPAWLNEGLAGFSEGSPSPQEESLLERAYREGHLLRLWDITPSFPSQRDPEKLVLAYAQSRSVVTYILERYGRDKLLDLLDAFKKDAGHAEAVRTVLGVEMDQLDKDWRDWLSRKYGASGLPALPIPGLQPGQASAPPTPEPSASPLGIPIWLMALVGASALVGIAMVLLKLVRALR